MFSYIDYCRHTSTYDIAYLQGLHLTPVFGSERGHSQPCFRGIHNSGFRIRVVPNLTEFVSKRLLIYGLNPTGLLGLHIVSRRTAFTGPYISLICNIYYDRLLNSVFDAVLLFSTLRIVETVKSTY